MAVEHSINECSEIGQKYVLGWSLQYIYDAWLLQCSLSKDFGRGRREYGCANLESAGRTVFSVEA